MSFDNPQFLFLLFALIPLPFALFFRYRRRHNEAELFAKASLGAEGGPLLRKYHLRMISADCFFIFSLGFSVIALASPRWGRELVPDYSRGVDLVLALDLSRSMNVRDCPPLPGKPEMVSRLDKALSMAYELGLNLEGIRLGAAIGKGRGVLALPLSYDPEVILNFLSGTNEFSITGAGTNLESLIDAAATAFKDNMPGNRCILLFSDGEALTGSLEAAVRRANDRGIIICAAGIGSDEGGAVPYNDGQLLSSSGLPVISARMSEALKGIAEKTGGVYADGNRSDAVLLLGDFYRSLSADSGLIGRRWETKSRSHIFVIAALLVLGLSRLLGFSLRKKRNSSPRAVPAALCFVFLTGLVPFLAGSCSPLEGKLFVMEGNFHQKRGYYNEAVSAYLRALEYPDSAPYAEYGLGSAYFALEEDIAALERYKSAESSLDMLPGEQHPELRFRLKYNMGIIFFEQGDFEKAIGAFRTALEIDGSRIEAKKNLELSLINLASGRKTSSSFDEQGEDPGAAKKEESSHSLVLFDYLRKREQELWKSKKWTEETEFSGPDY